MNPNLLTIYQSPFPKRRIGRWTDGGYAVVDIPDMKYDVLIAGGVCDDISFEEDFIRYQSENGNSIEVYAFDGTVSELPKSEYSSQIRFIQKNIGEFETDQITNIHSILSKYIATFTERGTSLVNGGLSGETLTATHLFRMYNDAPKVNKYTNIFVKMDIEGGEVNWIRSLQPEHMNAMAQIVMEFHRPFTDAEIPMFQKLNETHLPVHFHPNNCCGTRIHNGVYFPNVFECTYLHKRFFGGVAELNRDYIPNDKVDVRNVSSNDEIWIGHPPFVHFEKFERKL